eukprot:COSAG01_NODE_122_length_25212_cov_25.945646_12_plen_68_part_00
MSHWSRVVDEEYCSGGGWADLTCNDCATVDLTSCVRAHLAPLSTGVEAEPRRVGRRADGARTEGCLH